MEMIIGPRTWKEFRYYLHEDLKYTGGKPIKTFFCRYLFEPGFKYSFWMRLTRLFWLRGGYWFLAPRVILKHYEHKFHFEISYKAQIGPGLIIGHQGAIIVTSDTVIGKNCFLRPGVVFGKKQTEDLHGCVVGDNVNFGIGSKMIGKLNIGDNVYVGANAVVAKDVPSNCVVAGVPARVIRYLN